MRQITTLLLLLATGTAMADNTLRDRECLALAMYHEARGEGVEGMAAVGSVVLNRVMHSDFPNTVCGVVHQGGEQPPCQFSWWCDGKSDRPRNKASWQAANQVAAALISRQHPDATRGALYFHHVGVKPRWRHKRVARIGQHVFYR